MNIKGRSLELYFIDGKPDGMVTASVPFQWTGQILMTSRNQISEALKRPEAKRTGVYLLFGEVEEGPQIYIGEGEDISQRIRTHAINKDWWTSAVMITDAGDELNKAHVKYLESRLVEMASKVGKVELENSNKPPCPSLTEAQEANMEGFLENIFTVLPALRIDCFLNDIRSQKFAKQSAQIFDEVPQFELIIRKHGLKAYARLENGEFIVEKGSIAQNGWQGKGSAQPTYKKLFDDLVRQGILIKENDKCIFKEDYVFNSPSSAGGIINARSTNGTIEWKLKGSNKTYKKWELEQLDSKGN